MSEPTYSGGCQCGAVRFRVDGELRNSSICFCRMCQKGSGHLVGVYASTAKSAMMWTRGAPTLFRSSEAAERGFCARCGTNLTYGLVDGPRVSITLGSLDEPDRAPIERVYGIEAKPPEFDRLASLPGQRTDDYLPPSERLRYASRQHPDHDTEHWPIEEPHHEP